MTELALYPVLMGAVAMASLVAALFFLRFWRGTHDLLFLFFATAFAVDALTRVALALNHPSVEQEPFYFLTRLVTFGLIVVAIIHKIGRTAQTNELDLIVAKLASALPLSLVADIWTSKRRYRASSRIPAAVASSRRLQVLAE